MIGIRCTTPARRAAHVLQATYGSGSAAEASDRADEHAANIDFGGFAYWKVVEQVIRAGDAR